MPQSKFLPPCLQLSHYAFSMIIGLLLLLFWFVFLGPGAGA